MIDPTFADITDSELTTLTEYPTVESLQRKVAELESSLDTITQDRSFWQSKYHNLSSQVQELQEYIKDNFAYIDEEISQRLVEIFDLQITKEYDVQVTVTFTGTVEAPLNFDMDDLENELEANLQVSYYSNDVQADFMEDRMEIDWSEN